MTRIKHLLAALLLVAAALPAEAREFRVSSFEPPLGFYSRQVLQAWIDRINPKLTAGSRFRLYPGGILGAAPAQAELVKAGVADVALVVTNYTPGLFPLSGVVELPGVAPSATRGAAVLNALADDGTLAGEYADYKVIALFTTPGYRIFTSRGARKPADLAGLKLRTPSPFASELLALMGASGVSIPAPQVYENLERGVVAGAVWVFDAYKTFRLNEVAPAITSTRLTASPMAILMNRAAYESMPEADRKVLDELAGRATAEWIADIVDTADAEIEKSFRDANKVTFIDPADDEAAAWNAVVTRAPDIWIAAQPDRAAASATLAKAKAASGG
ncbi:MAG: TRAP transporter substrate-binding protein [Pseudochelatococcus sp.]|jgi:TRAP-type C4-dicarboxylate transport system substrate-binding protein|uniref:TRAP transporter substrate-binding protein n=1 Tax=Pseudochelatococcus sp. TaxID=2020869 RepID=UPI003D92EA12